MNNYIIHQGVDLHKKFFTFCSLDDRTGMKTEGKVYNSDPEALREYLNQFDAPSEVAVEASRGWYWFVDMLQEAGVMVHLANPKQTKAIAWARVKNDRVDARTLCHLLKSDLLPTCWIPEKPWRDVREIVRYRMKLVRTSTQFKNVIHSYLGKQNIHPEFRSIWSGKGREWLEEVELKYPHEEMKEYCLELIDHLDKVIHEYDKKLKAIGYRPKGIELVETIPYAGYTRALTIVIETGPMEIFRSSKSYIACCGLAPTTRSSGGRTKQGKISKEARLVLKWAFIEIANKAWTVDNELCRYYKRISFKKGKSIAKISLARKLAKGVYHMLKEGIDFDEYKKIYIAG